MSTQVITPEHAIQIKIAEESAIRPEVKISFPERKLCKLRAYRVVAQHAMEMSGWSSDHLVPEEDKEVMYAAALREKGFTVGYIASRMGVSRSDVDAGIQMFDEEVKRKAARNLFIGPNKTDQEIIEFANRFDYITELLEKDRKRGKGEFERLLDLVEQVTQKNKELQEMNGELQIQMNQMKKQHRVFHPQQAELEVDPLEIPIKDLVFSRAELTQRIATETKLKLGRIVGNDKTLKDIITYGENNLLKKRGVGPEMIKTIKLLMIRYGIDHLAIGWKFDALREEEQA